MRTRAQGKCHRLWASQAHTIYLAGLVFIMRSTGLCVCLCVAKRQKVLKPDFCFSYSQPLDK